MLPESSTILQMFRWLGGTYNWNDFLEMYLLTYRKCVKSQGKKPLILDIDPTEALIDLG